jgi:membrane protease YdiL (CAAX protease family)
MIIAITLGFLPILFGATKKNIYVGIIVHILCNSVGFVTGIVFITKMS